MEHIIKQFADSLNKSLDDLDVPIQIKERATILSKMLGIPKQHAWNLLEGTQMPDNELLERIKAEIEIEETDNTKNT
jgi:hypothetical protein